MDESLLDALAVRNLRRLATEASLDLDLTRAYRHANGFDKVTLSPEGAAVTVRAHFWHASSKGDVGQQSAHNHRWDFCSRVLRGAVRVQLLAHVANGESYRHYQYRPGPADDLRLVGEVPLSVTRDHVYEAGDFYVEDHSLIHVAEAAPNSETITVVAHGSARNAAADVFTRGEPPLMGERAKTLSHDDLRAHLRSLAQLLEGMGWNQPTGVR